jgi:hypothetical protein
MSPVLLRMLFLAPLFLPAAGRAADELTTIAEQSGFTRTGRYAEVTELCRRFAARWPDSVRCESFGATPEGRPMQLLVVSTDGVLTPAAAQQKKRPVVLVQGGIHAGEIDGKDAGFLLLRELLEGKVGKGLLERQVLVFVPVFNVDGHERFGRWNRPNQRGPEEMGWRTTAHNFNLNRDYVKADAPEMRAMLQLLQRWDPLAYIDLHVTDGAQFEHDVSIQVEPLHAGDVDLRAAGRALRDGTIDKLARQGSLPLPFYPAFVEYDNPASGFADGVPTPRYSTGYLPLRNRLGMLVETHSWKSYPTRVRITRNAVLAVLELVARSGGDWLAAAHAADAAATRIGGETVALDWAANEEVRTIEFRGYEYTRTPSEVSGALMTRYDEQRPAIWKLPLRDQVVPGTQVRAPRGGYLVPVEHAGRVQPWLEAHGVEYHRLAKTLSDLAVESFHSSEATFAAAPFEGRQRLTVKGEWRAGTQDVAAGALFVPIEQPLARVAIALLEPQAPDSLLAWGEFNNQFEQKEYLEAYVAEAVAREMLKADPALRAEFERRVATDAKFAADPAARLEFFHRRHPSWDDRYQRYPVLRSEVSLR